MSAILNRIMSLQTRRGLQLFITIAAFTVLAAGLSYLQLQPGRSYHLLEIALQNLRAPAPVMTASPGGGSEEFVRIMRIIFWVLAPAAVIYAFISKEFRRQILRVAIIVVALLLMMDRLAQQRQESAGAELPPLGETGEATAYALPDPPAFVTDTPGWFYWAIDVALILMAVGLLWLLWRKLRPQPDARDDVVRTAERSLAELRSGGELRDVVLRCYAEMSRVLREERRIERRSGMTPREFERHLAGLGLRDEHIHRLTQLFERVRYSTDTGDAADQREAEACLQAIVQSYGIRPAPQNR